VNPIASIGEQLRTARQSQGHTFEDIAAATRINQKTLDEIERGILPKLPLTYIRAFIKAYAEQVGLNPDELLQHEALRLPTSNVSQPATSLGKTVAEVRININPVIPESTKPRQRNVLVVLSILLIGGLIVTLYLANREKSSQPVQEISFNEMIAKEEKRDTTVGSDTSRAHAHSDSLVLEGFAKESTWVQIVVDGKLTNEYTLPPNYRMQWKAKENFLLSIGNAGGISFSLNNRKLGSFGTERKPKKNISLSWNTLKQ